jgi:LPS sulfotransferase NodH
MNGRWFAPRLASYTIAFTLRSGSNLLCDYLTANGFGRPNEYFQHSLEPATPRDFSTALQRLLTEHSVNGIFGAKVTWDQKNWFVDAIRRHFGSDDGVDFLSPRHRWIFLRRRDKVEQAVSVFRAKESGAWTSAQQPGTGAASTEYDFFRILGFMQAVLTRSTSGTSFRRAHIEPVQVGTRTSSITRRRSCCASHARCR